MKCRNLGVKLSSGEIIVFLDSHCEVTNFWLEPLIKEILINNNTIAVPELGLIDNYSFQFYYNNKNRYVGGFTWSLKLNKMLINNKNLKGTNYETPIMIGGNYAINKQYFLRMGGYDENMKNYGGDDIEMSLRVWMCGGRLVMVSCSIIGHVSKFKTQISQLKYENMRKYNLIRIADIWLDDYNKIFRRASGYQIFDYFLFFHLILIPSKFVKFINYRLTKSNPINPIKRKLLRKNLNCKSFKWFLNNIFYQQFIPGTELYNGVIINIYNKYCLINDVKLKLINCSDTIKLNFKWFFTKIGEIRNSNWEYCWTISKLFDNILMENCLYSSQSNQIWFYDNKIKKFIHKNSNLCLDLIKKKITLYYCSSTAIYQQWQWI